MLGELARARDGLKDINTIDELVSDPDQPGAVTMDNLLDRMRDNYDILYLVCHGALMQRDNLDPDSHREPYLWLEKEDGTADVAAGENLVGRIRDMSSSLRPSLIVLASCQSAGKGKGSTTDQGGLAGLGPRLSQAGVPAVIAMQGNVFMDTVTEFIPVFFKELSVDGHLDRAMAAARGAVRERDDWQFRVFFRMVMAQEGKERLGLFSHAAAQIEPEENRVLDAQRARRYLEKYFEGEKISLYWGSSEDFLSALWEHMEEA